MVRIKFSPFKCALLSLFLFINICAFSQDCESTVTFRLKNINGGSFGGQKVTLTPKWPKALSWGQLFTINRLIQRGYEPLVNWYIMVSPLYKNPSLFPIA